MAKSKKKIGVIGIDPGSNGYLCILSLTPKGKISTKHYRLDPIPSKTDSYAGGHTVDECKLLSLVDVLKAEYDIIYAGIEGHTKEKGQRSISALIKRGENNGKIKTFLAMLKADYITVHPIRWQSELRKPLAKRCQLPR
jgi:hypothetical protein